MKTIRAAGYILLCFCLVRPVSALENKPSDGKCEACTNCSETGGQKFDLVFDLARNSASGNKIRGPAKIKITNANVLRYDIQVGVKVTFSAGPKIDLPFIPTPSAPAAKTAESGKAAAEAQKSKDARKKEMDKQVISAAPSPRTLEEEWDDIVIEWNNIETELGEVREKILDNTKLVNDVSSQVVGLVTTSDATLQAGGAKTLADAVRKRLPSIEAAAKADWPDGGANKLATDIRLLTNKLVALPSLYPDKWQEWYAKNKSVYEQLKTRLDTLATSAQGLLSSSEEGKKFAQAKDGLARWGVIFAGVAASGEAAFCIIYRVSCSFTFDSNKESLVSVVKRDRLAVSTSKVGETPPGNEGTVEIATVVCSSPLTVSAGFGFSSITEKEFVFVQSTKPVTGTNGEVTQKVINVFGFKNNSSFRTLPVLLLNTRFYEPNETFAFHASAGAAVDIKGQTGTDIEYIVGGSVSFMRSFFVTPALHIGRVPTLVGGFSLGQEVPEGIKEPPVEKAWKKAFAVTFTYKIR